MKRVGIVAEYNPFHRGHLRQLRLLREQGAELIAVAMSGNFVQRGAPAWTDKYLRTTMALEQGVDFIFELPVLYSLASAEGFAFGGISLLNRLPLDTFCFGCETDSLDILDKTAETLTAESSDFHRLLQEQLRRGSSFPAAREYALRRLMPELETPGSASVSDSATASGSDVSPDSTTVYASRDPSASSLLSGANNILAIEYLKASKKLKSKMTPLAIRRNDAGYHSGQLSGDGLSSATAIRNAYAESGELSSCRSSLPEEVFALLQGHPGHYPAETKDFSSVIYYSLQKALREKRLTSYGEISEALANRIGKLLPEYQTPEQFIRLIKTKNITRSHISRSLFQLLLGIDKDFQKQIAQPVPYLRLLGMRRQKSSLLREVTALPVITRVADYKKQLPEPSFARSCFELDLLAADLYRQILFQKTGVMLSDEYRSGVIIR